MYLPDHILTWLGAIATLVAALAWWGDHRCRHRKDLDAVGWMPWTGLFFFALFVAVMGLGLGVREWIGG